MPSVQWGATSTAVLAFQPVSTALRNLPNGPGTLAILWKPTLSAAATDGAGLLDSTATDWFHSITIAASQFSDDDGFAFNHQVATMADTHWYITVVDWGSGVTVERFHSIDLTIGGAWVHADSFGNNGGTRAGPATGRFRIGYLADSNIGSGQQIALVGVWAGVRLSDTNSALLSTNKKTSDWYNNPAGAPTFLCEVTSLTPVDLINPASTQFSSANSVLTNLTVGGNPAGGWTFDGLGNPVASDSFSISDVATRIAAYSRGTRNFTLSTIASDNFNRADGPLGTGWTAHSDGSDTALALAGQDVRGQVANNPWVSGNYRTDTYGNDQFSQFQVTTSTLGSDEWEGASVRVQNSGGDFYSVLYYRNAITGNYELRLYKRNSGTFTLFNTLVLGAALALNTTLTLIVIGNTLTALQNGIPVLTASDSSISTGGVPGLIAYGNSGRADNWIGGTPSLVLSDSFSISDVASSATGGGSGSRAVSDSFSISDVANRTQSFVRDASSAAVSDNFNRANGAIAGANWVAFGGINDVGLNIVSQQIQGPAGTGTLNGNYRTGTFLDDQFAQIEIRSQPSSGDWLGVCTRAQANGGYIAGNFYRGFYFNSGGIYTIILGKRVAGVNSTLSSNSLPGPLPIGTTIKLSVTGNTLRVAINGVSTYITTDVANSIPSGGAPGTMAFNSGAASNGMLGDNFIGGNLTTATPDALSFSDAATRSGAGVSKTSSDSFSVSDSASISVAPHKFAADSFGFSDTTPRSAQSFVRNASSVPVSISDDFNRADGVLGTGWSPLLPGFDGSMAIVSQQIRGSVGLASINGNYRTGTFGNDQFAQIEIGSQPAIGDWIGLSLRTQNSGANLYRAFYYNNGGFFEFQMGVRRASVFTGLFTIASVALLPIGTVLRFSVVGNVLQISINGVPTYTFTDTDNNISSGGAPGVMTFISGVPSTGALIDNFVGGDFVTTPDSFPVSDAATRAGALTSSKSSSDSFSVSDSATISVALHKTVVDNISFSDSASRVASTTKQGFESWSISDSAFSVPVCVASDTISISDFTVISSEIALRHSSDVLTFSDIATIQGTSVSLVENPRATCTVQIPFRASLTITRAYRATLSIEPILD